jgi:hypothetical protein
VAAHEDGSLMKALSTADKEKILGDNAMKMFGMTGNGAH